MFMPKPKQIIPITIIAVCFFISIWCLTASPFTPVSSENIHFSQKEPSLVVIDAGHGGSDPGKIGITGSYEKDINLEIARKLQSILEQQNVQVVMTRDDDSELAGTEGGWKLADMKKRIAIINEAKPDAVISIHQNSYTSPDIHGAQCFYYTDAEEGRELAALLQAQIITSTGQTKIREIKPNSDYYLLKKSSSPTVIVECGFLSNPDEEQLLLDPFYQRKMAWAIHLGVIQYLRKAPSEGSIQQQTEP